MHERATRRFQRRKNAPYLGPGAEDSRPKVWPAQREATQAEVAEHMPPQITGLIQGSAAMGVGFVQTDTLVIMPGCADNPVGAASRGPTYRSSCRCAGAVADRLVHRGR